MEFFLDFPGLFDRTKDFNEFIGGNNICEASNQVLHFRVFFLDFRMEKYSFILFFDPSLLRRDSIAQSLPLFDICTILHSFGYLLAGSWVYLILVSAS